MTATLDLGNGTTLTFSRATAERLYRSLAEVLNNTDDALLAEDHPLWRSHSGGTGHSGPEWTADDIDLAVAFYVGLRGKARLFFDLLLDRPGRLVGADELIEASEGEFSTSYSVAGAINGLRKPHRASGRRYPFYWWEGAPTRYAIKPSVAAVFAKARSVA